MPKPVPLNYIFDVAMLYIIKRQKQGRPTTVRQLSKRVGVGVSTVLRFFDMEKVQYYTFTYRESAWTSSEMEIAVRSLPEKAAARVGLTVAEVEESYAHIFGNEEPGEDEESLLLSPGIENLDPYYPYRIESEQFREMRGKLLSYDELLDAAKERGVPGAAILRAIGGDRLKRPLASEVWRPYVYKNHRYYAKEVLKHLDEAFITYRWEGYGKRKQKEAKSVARNNRRSSMEDGEGGIFFA